MDVGFLAVAERYFAEEDAYHTSSVLNNTGGWPCFVIRLVGWYIVFHLFLGMRWWSYRWGIRRGFWEDRQD